MNNENILIHIKNRKHRFPVDWVCLTGGEPLLQDVRILCRRLRAEGFKVQVETNGTITPPPEIDWLTVSPKPPEYAVAPECVEKAREVKLVVSRDLTLDKVVRLRSEFPAATPLLLQPQSLYHWSGKKAMTLLRRASKNGQKNIRLSLQMHRVLGIK